MEEQLLRGIGKKDVVVLAVMGMLMWMGMRAGATELLPGEIIAVSEISAGTYVSPIEIDPFFDTYGGSFQYQASDVGDRRSYVFYNTLAGLVLPDAAGTNELVYSFGYPQFSRTRPPMPTDPIEKVADLPADAQVSVAGFGTGPVDVSMLEHTGFNASVSFNMVQRSASGDVITFSGFTSTGSVSDYGQTDGIAFIVPGKSFGDSTATLTDMEGEPRTLSVEVIGPVPEPTSLAMMALAVVTLTARGGRRFFQSY